MSMETGLGPITGATPVTHNDALPDAVDLVVIGGGVIGIFTALFARRRGLSVLVCEKGRVAGEQSSRNWGWIRQHGRDEAELPIMMEASRLWEETDDRTNGATGFSRRGVMYLASSDAALERRIEWAEMATTYGLDVEILGRKGVLRHFSSPIVDQASLPWIGAGFTPSDARAEPWRAVPAVASLASAKGVLIRENCAVRCLDIRGEVVCGVVTEAGTVSCEQVLLAGGAWSSLFARRHGIDLPQLSVRSSVARTGPLPEIFPGNAADEQLALRRRQDGGYTISANGSHDLFLGPDSFRHFFAYLPVAKEHLHETRFKPWAPANFPDGWSTARRWEADERTPFENMRVLDPEPHPATAERAKAALSLRFPKLGQPEILNVWAGMIDTMPDIVPVVDQAQSPEGLWIATGMSGHGFGIGPGFGRILADLMTGRPAGHDLSRFRLGRFTDGSALIPGPSI